VTEPTGRRERKKAQTRKSLADAALRLFLDHGYDQVSVKDVADAADVSVTTLFKHFPSKEALLFDRDDYVEAALVMAVRKRPHGQSILHSLRELVLRTEAPVNDPEFGAFIRLIDETPALRDYNHRMWMRHETALAQAIAEEIGAPKDDTRCAALAHFVLETRTITHPLPDRQSAVREVFALLEYGWTWIESQYSHRQ
jgi:AcrR family transcriptional regulator